MRPILQPINIISKTLGMPDALLFVAAGSTRQASSPTGFDFSVLSVFMGLVRGEKELLLRGFKKNLPVMRTA
jgi:hypothetical protein